MGINMKIKTIIFRAVSFALVTYITESMQDRKSVPNCRKYFLASARISNYAF